MRFSAQKFGQGILRPLLTRTSLVTICGGRTHRFLLSLGRNTALQKQNSFHGAYQLPQLPALERSDSAMSAATQLHVQLRASDAASLREGRSRTRSTRARPVAASGRNVNINAVQFAEDKGSGLLLPVGKYCESHHKTIRRPTR